MFRREISSQIFLLGPKSLIILHYLEFKKLKSRMWNHSSHFKMKPIEQVIHMIKPNIYRASHDIKDDFYIVSIFEPYIKYLKFIWLNKAYQFIVRPIGYVDPMRVFSKILKPPFCQPWERFWISGLCRWHFVSRRNIPGVLC